MASYLLHLMTRVIAEIIQTRRLSVLGKTWFWNLGMLLATLGRPKVAILLHQQDQMERPSDIQGLLYIAFRDNLENDAGLLLAKEMVAAGYQIDVAKV